MDVFSEIEIEALVEEGLVSEPTEVLGVANLVNQEVEFEALSVFLENTQDFDPFEPDWLMETALNTRTNELDSSDWLTDFIESDAVADSVGADKPSVTFIDDDDDDDENPGITSWGTLISIATGSLGDYSLGNTNIAGYDGDADTGLDGTPDGDTDDEVIAVGTRVNFERSDVFILRGSNGSFSFHHNGNVFDNESDWINSLLDELLQILSDNTNLEVDTTIGIAPGLNLDVLETLPLATRRAILEFFIGNLPNPG